MVCRGRPGKTTCIPHTVKHLCQLNAARVLQNRGCKGLEVGSGQWTLGRYCCGDAERGQKACGLVMDDPLKVERQEVLQFCFCQDREGKR